MFHNFQSSLVSVCIKFIFHSLSLGSLDCLYFVWYAICVLYTPVFFILRITNSSRDKNKKNYEVKMNETPDVTLAYNNRLIERRLSVKLLAISSEVYVCSGFSFNNIYLHLSTYIYICFVYLFCCLHLSFTSHSIILSPFMLSNNTNIYK